jgi:tetratricopeptide (TPR) repeat protein
LYKLIFDRENSKQLTEPAKKIFEKATNEGEVVNLKSVFQEIVNLNLEENTGLNDFFDKTQLISIGEALDIIPFGNDIKKKFYFFFQNKNYKEIANIEAEIFAISPNDVNIIWALAITFYKLKEYNKSLFYCKKHLDLDSSSSTIFANIGYCYLALNDKIQAAQYIEKALDINPKDSFALKNMGLLNLCLNKLEEAELYLEKSILINSQKEIIINILISDKEYVLENKNYDYAFLTDFIEKHKQ